MKKRLVCLLLALVLSALTAIPCFAAKPKDPLTKLEIWVTEPRAREKLPAPEVEVHSGNKTLADKTEYVLSYAWTCNGTVTTGNAVAGKTYELTITLKGLLEEYETIDETEFFVDGDKVAGASLLTASGNDLVIALSYIAETEQVVDITPKLETAVDGKLVKEYDGENVTLRVNVANEQGKTAYKYQWFKDGIAVSGATLNSLNLRDVDASGVYVCKVTAVSGSEQKESESKPFELKITPREVTILLEDAEKTAGDDDPELVYKAAGVVEGDALSGEPEREAGEAEGDYVIGIGTLAFAEDVAGNYSVTVRNGRFTIVGTGEVAYSPLPASRLSDISKIRGQNAAEIRVFTTKEALPKGGLLVISRPVEKVTSDFTAAADGKKILKAFTLSVTVEDNAGASLNKNARLRLMIPLSEKEAAYKKGSVQVLFRKANGTVSTLEAARKEEDDGTVYLVAELQSLGSVALLEGEAGAVTPAKVDETDDGETGEVSLFGRLLSWILPKAGPRRNSVVLWLLAILFTLAAVGIVIGTVIRARKFEEPTKTYVPAKKPTRPAPPAAGQEKAPPAKKPISFDDLEDDD